MKLKSKLIPILTGAGVVAATMPIALTSCGDWVRYNNMLHKYETGVLPFQKTTFDSANTAGSYYTKQVHKNIDVFRDDFLFTISSTLNNADAKNKLASSLTFTTYEMDVLVDMTTNPEDATLMSPCFHFISHFVGECKDGSIKIDNHAITTFDIVYDGYVVAKTNNNSKFEFLCAPDGEKAPYKAAYDLKDYYVPSIQLKDSYCEMYASGSYSYNDSPTNGVKTVTDYNVHEVFVASLAATCDKYSTYQIFTNLIARICYGAAFSFDASSTIDKLWQLPFASHYFKDVTINY